jgi:antitoxin CcdA
MKAILPAAAPKEAASPSVDATLLVKGRLLKLDLAQVFEQALPEGVRQHERARWLLENQQTIADYAEAVEQHGVFSDGLRSF